MIEMRLGRAKRRNGAAYQHRRRRSLTGGHAVIAHGRRMEYQRSRSMVRLQALDRKTHHQVMPVVRSCFVAPETGAERPWERLLIRNVT
jgi:hypothetical protein